MQLSKIIPFVLISIFTVLLSCGEPDITPDMIDGEVIFDASLYDPEAYLVSYSNPNPTIEEAEIPVIIVSHGYSASTFEWNEFREWNDSNPEILISQVLLSGHGRTYEDFKNTNWQDWSASILEEYDRLVMSGYKNIHFAGSSTSSTLILDIVNSGYFNDKIVPGNIFLIDPIIIPSSKSLSLVGIIGPMLGYIEADNTLDEDKYWYHFRPEETLRELMKLMNVVRKDLQSGILLPSGCALKVYKSKRDPTADPAGAILIYKGLRNANGDPIEIEMIDSDLHVFTRLSLRAGIVQKDVINQQNTFEDMLNRILN
jgi:carboxylesterase